MNYKIQRYLIIAVFILIAAFGIWHYFIKADGPKLLSKKDKGETGMDEAIEDFANESTD